MSETDELRRQLDELRKLACDINEEEIRSHRNHDWLNAWLNAWHAEFERILQAVEATLERGTCHAIDSGCATAFCSVCGAEFMGSIMTNEPPDYVKPLTRCPECGRKIVEVDDG